MDINCKEKVTDEELILQICKAKEFFLFGVLYDRYQHLVFNKCYGFVRSKDEAKDLTQDVFLHVYEKLSTFKGESRFSTWLYSVTTNFGNNYLNRNKERKITSNSKPINEVYDLAAEINDYNFYQLQIDQLQVALTQLKREDSLLLILKYQDNVSLKKLQKQFGLSESAIKMRLLRAKSKVINAYKAYDIQ